MEVLALDPEQVVENPIVKEIALLKSPAILVFDIERADLEGVVGALEEINIEYTGPVDLERKRPDGEILRWRLLFPGSSTFKCALPIFIDWMDAPHPSTSAPTGYQLMHFEIGHPKYLELISLYEKLNVNVPVVYSKEAFAKATMDTPKGEVVLHGFL